MELAGFSPHGLQGPPNSILHLPVQIQPGVGGSERQKWILQVKRLSKKKKKVGNAFVLAKSRV